MQVLSRSVVAVAALVAMVSVAQAATAGHLLKSTPPATDANQDVTGSIKKPDATDPDITGSITKPHAKKRHVTGTIKPEVNPEH
jgi:hypothetical protein